MIAKLTYKDAIPSDSKMLSATVIASKKTWGYSDDLINLWKSELQISKEYIRRNKVIKVYNENKYIGFYGIKFNEPNSPELDHFWLTPENIRKGYGKIIFNNISNYLKAEGYNNFFLVAEPNAKRFYEKMSGKVIRQSQSKASGRFLDIYEFDLT
ncbi:MAG TPA: GNAT family N-acetyltransferase [Ignavibacteriaceae bacterium]|nr:GNAT family N-acetyltransferase [Ignavibacteriaceae bacterium]